MTVGQRVTRRTYLKGFWAEVPENGKLAGVAKVIVEVTERLEEDSFRVRSVQLDTEVSDGWQPGRSASSEELHFAPLDVDLQNVDPLRPCELQQSWNIPGFHGSRRVPGITRQHLRSPFPAVAEGSAREHKATGFRPCSSAQHPCSVSISGEIEATEGIIIGVGLHNKYGGTGWKTT